jgi:hypothetical protein
MDVTKLYGLHYVSHRLHDSKISYHLISLMVENGYKDTDMWRMPCVD